MCGSVVADVSATASPTDTSACRAYQPSAVATKPDESPNGTSRNAKARYFERATPGFIDAGLYTLRAMSSTSDLAALLLVSQLGCAAPAARIPPPAAPHPQAPAWPPIDEAVLGQHALTHGFKLGRPTAI